MGPGVGWWTGPTKGGTLESSREREPESSRKGPKSVSLP